MYLEYFGFQEEPFNITPNSKFLFLSERHREALAALLYGIDQRKGFIALTGEIGCGKTTICRSMLGKLDRQKTRLALVLNPEYNDLELLQTINAEYGLESLSASKRQLLDALNRFLLNEYKHDRNVVLLIDEAQRLSPDALEQVRLLSNLETETAKLIQIALVGQPELADILNLPELEQLNQRITVRYHIEPLTFDEVTDYVSHRIAIAEPSNFPVRFTKKALRRVYEYSSGVPRRINVVCDRALLVTFVREQQEVGEDNVEKAIEELGGMPRQRRKPSPALPANTPPPDQESAAVAPAGASGNSSLLFAVTFVLLIGAIAFGLSRRGSDAGSADFAPESRATPAGSRPVPDEVASIPDKVIAAEQRPVPASPIPTPPPSPAPTSTPEPTPRPTPEPTATATPEPSESPAPTATETPAATPTAEPSATPAPSPTPMPTLEASPVPSPATAEDQEAAVPPKETGMPAAPPEWSAPSTPLPAPAGPISSLMAQPAHTSVPATVPPWRYDDHGIMRVDKAEMTYPASLLTWLEAKKRDRLPESELQVLRSMSREQIAALQLTAGRAPLYLREARLPASFALLAPEELPVLVQFDDSAPGFGPWALLVSLDGKQATLHDTRSGVLQLSVDVVLDHLAAIVVPFFDPEGITGLRPGASGPSVRALQARLRDAGFYMVEPSAQFDPFTEAALGKFRDQTKTPGSSEVDAVIARRLLAVKVLAP